MPELKRPAFAADPFGYSAFAWETWGRAQTHAGYPVDPKHPPTSADLKSPILWLAHAHALSEAACAVLDRVPEWESMPVSVRRVCDSQYCAAGVMLVGYSLEVCLKAMLILTKGIEAYASAEKQFQHHRLERLAEHMPNLTPKDKAVLRLLTQFTEWAGRYPDPGSGREAKLEEVFALSERHQIAGRDLFGLAARVMKHTQVVVDQYNG